MGSAVLQPPKLYLDTNHLINIANLRKGKDINNPRSVAAYKQLDDCIRNKHFGLILNPAACLEWVDGNATLETAFEIADVVESATLQYEIEADFHVYLYEVLKELKCVSPGLNLPEYEIFGVRKEGSGLRRPIPVLLKEVPSCFAEELKRGIVSEEAMSLPDVIEFSSVRGFVESAYNLRRKKPDLYRERVDGHKSAFSRDLNEFNKRKEKSIQVQDRNDWIKRYLRVECILSALNPGVDVDATLNKIDFSRCPAANLFLKAHEKRIMAGKEANENDGDDWAFLHVFPYADLMLTERQLSHFVRQADNDYEKKVTHDPTKAIEILKPWF